MSSTTPAQKTNAWVVVAFVILIIYLVPISLVAHDWQQIPKKSDVGSGMAALTGALGITGAALVLLLWKHRSLGVCRQKYRKAALWVLSVCFFGLTLVFCALDLCYGCWDISMWWLRDAAAVLLSLVLVLLVLMNSYPK